MTPTGKKNLNSIDLVPSMAEGKVPNNKLRSFGLIVATGFAVIGVWPAVFRGQHLRLWALVIAVLMCTAGLVYPPILRSVYKVWMGVGEALGWVNTRIVLGVLFYGVIVPIGIMLRLRHKDPMRRKFDRAAPSYRILRTKRPAAHMQRQF
jgi:saxitoxin biosynthesis operon SxtJ-like protein